MRKSHTQQESRPAGDRIRNVAAALLVSLSPCLLISLSGCSRSPSSEPIVIAHLASLSGPDRLAGEHARRGILLAVEEANNDPGRVAGRRVEVVLAEAHPGEMAAGEETVRLITINRVIALLASTDPAQAGQIGRASRPYGIPLLTSSPLPGQPPSETAFSTSVAPRLRGHRLAQFAEQQLQARHVVVLHNSTDALETELADGFCEELGKSKQVRVERWSREGDTVSEELARRLQQAKPAAVFSAGSERSLKKLCSLWPVDNLRPALLYGGDELGWPELLAEAEVGPKVYVVTSFTEDENNPLTRELNRRYRERFHEEPDLHAAAGYEMAALLFEAMRRGQSEKSEHVREMLTGSEPFAGLTGPLTFEKDNHDARRPIFVVTNKAGRFQFIKQYEPSSGIKEQGPGG